MPTIYSQKVMCEGEREGERERGKRERERERNDSVLSLTTS
jgi:hypothetical protein